MPELLLTTHSRFFDHYGEWSKWRTVYEGGQGFINAYLEKFSSREDEETFSKRKRVTPTASFAASSIDEVRDAILNRLHLVRRVGGSELYESATRGEGFGVDLHGNSMTTFIGQEVLPELLVMQRVGVYMDMPSMLPEDRVTQDSISPYIYIYPREDVLDWREMRDHPGRLQFVSLLDRPIQGPLAGKVINRQMTLLNDGVLVEFFQPTDEASALFKLGVGNIHSEASVEAIAQMPPMSPIDNQTVFLRGLKEIPFWLADIGRSLMRPVANHQIALMNLESSDIGYCLMANFPFYVEQGGKYGADHLNGPGSADGTAAGGVARKREIQVGGNTGRQYSGEKQPDFINPSPEPMRVSMEKQANLKSDIRRLLHQQVAGLSPNSQQSADSAEFQERPLEAGLSHIGHVLQVLENAVGRFWTNYRTRDERPTVTYPSVWSLETDRDRHSKADDLTKLRVTIPSKTFQHAVSKQIADTLLAGKITQEEMDSIHAEIDSSPGVTADPETIALLIEKNVLDLENAAVLAGVPPEAPKKAEDDHARRLERITIAQGQDNATHPGTAGNQRESERDPSDKSDGKGRQRQKQRRGRTQRAAAARSTQ